MFSSGAGGVPESHITSAEPVNGMYGIRLRPYHGFENAERPGASAGWRMRAPIVRAMIRAVASETW